jgi:hypothetical protein
MNSEIREEIKRIQSELRKPFAPEVHGIRELPGRGYWAFAPHHEYRERLDEVYPEWQASYTPIEQITSDVICRCTITILGISKQAIGSVPLVAAEKNGKDVSRGSAADRVAAEAFKNACEAWGVGRYLDKQGDVAHYLNTNATKLDYETRNKLRPLADYLRGKGELPPANSNLIMPKLDAPDTDLSQPVPVVKGKCISEGQGKRLWAIAKQNKMESSAVKHIVRNIAGVESTKDIPVHIYEQVIAAITSNNTNDQPTDLGTDLPEPVPNRELLAQEINSLRKRKGIPKLTVDQIMTKITGGKKVSWEYTDLELLKIRDEFVLLPNYLE